MGLLILSLAGGSAAQESAAQESAAQDRDENSLIGQLEFKLEKPKTVAVYPGSDVGGSASGIPQSGRVYWYLRYTLSNKGKKEGRFFVTLTARSDKGQRYSDLALAFVEKKIEKIEQRKLWSKSDLIATGKKIDAYLEFSPGEKKECVAIFNPLDGEADKIVIDVHGLVDDIELEDLGGGRFRVTERVLRITFLRPGDEFYTSMDRFKFAGKEWISITREIPSSG
ncbi:MAG: hypothetical protein ACE5GW_01970 [Planctomycetota bacterium]